MTSTDYEHPYRPLGVRAFNRLGTAGANFGLSDRLDVDSLRDAARRRTGLSDFGDDGHAEALEVLVASINDEARLSAAGRLIQKSRLTDALVQRLRIQDLVTRHPEIENIDLGTIILITGLQRTGTTLLQRLLCSHPQIRGITGAEALVPVATGETAERSERSRRWRAMLAQRTVSYLAPDFQAIHPVGHDQAEEDVLLLDLNFMSQTAEATMTVPGYSRWLEDQDHIQNCEFLRRVLQVLAWQRPTSAWVLKTPHHLEHLDAFCTVFGSATVVQAHRDPRVTLASFCSMVAHGRGIFSDQVDPAEIGRHWCRKTQRMVERAMQVRAGSPASQFVDVSYYDLIADPINEVRRICEATGVGFDAVAESEAEQFIAANPQNRFGRHVYRLDDFGLTEHGVDETFAAYREAYAIPFEDDQHGSPSADPPPSPSAEDNVPASRGRPERGLGDRGFVGAAVTAFRDLRNPKAPDFAPVPDGVRIDGTTCLVTGANSGLGRAAAVELARRGGRMVLACRPGHDGVCEEIKRESGSESVELVEVDLADLRSVHRCCDELRDRGIRIDLALMNAGLMTPAAQRSAQGYDEMFAVHFLANRVMIDRWLFDGVVVPAVPGGDRPRIVFVSSEAHRSSASIDFDRLGEFVPYGMKDSLRHYGVSKLALCTYATELSRRLNRRGEADCGVDGDESERLEVAVHALCPGGVATNITRGAPAPLRSVVDPLIRLFFRSPEDAVEPVIWLCCAPEAGSSTGLYLHLMHRKQVSESAADPANGARLWEASQVMVEQSRGMPMSATPPAELRLTHLQQLESEAIGIMREVVAQCERPVMLYSIGKDSSVLLHLARKAFFPGRIPFPLLHVDTTWKFREMIVFRQRMADEIGFELIVHTNADGVAQGINPFDHGSKNYTDIMKTQALRQALDAGRFDAAFGGARRDEEKSRSKERVFSFRDAHHRWDPKNQRPELWNLYNGRVNQGESIRVFPMSNWTELDVWQYIHLEQIPIVPLYFAAERPVVERDGVLIMVDDDRFVFDEGEVAEQRLVRFRTLGCYPLSGAIESSATTLPEIIGEMLVATRSEREGRVIDFDQSGSMEQKKLEGYF